MSINPDEESKTAPASESPQDKTPQDTSALFLDQTFLDNLGVMLDGKKIPLFSSVRFFSVLYRHAQLGLQAEPLHFLSDIYNLHCTRRNATPEQIENEAKRLLSVYVTDSNSGDKLNVACTAMEAAKQGVHEGKMLASFASFATEAVSLIQGNMLRPITLFNEGGRTIPSEEVMKALREARQKDIQDEQDKLFLPARSVICSALEGIDAAIKRLVTLAFQLTLNEQQLNPVDARRMDALVEDSVKKAREFQQKLQILLIETTKPDASVAIIQQKLSTLFQEGTFPIEENSGRLNKRLGTDNSRSAKINELLTPILAAKQWHDDMTLPVQMIESSRLRDEKTALKTSSLKKCKTRENRDTVDAYVKSAKETKSEPEQPASLMAWVSNGLKRMRPGG